MKRRAFTAVMIVVSMALPALAAAPKVVMTSPDNGDNDVSSDITEIRIEFDQPMNAGGRSIVGGGDSFPEISGKLKWLDDHTFLMPVTLKPDHAYAFSVNSDTFKNFRGQKGPPCEWYPVEFQTRAAGAAPAKPDVTPAQNKKAIEALKHAIDRDYAYRDLKHVEWAREIASREQSLESARTANEFARLTAHLLRLAEDAHVFVEQGKLRIFTRANSASPNFNVQSLMQVVPGWAEQPSGIVTGRIEGGGAPIGYILLSECSAQQANGFDAALDQMNDTQALIIDARFNGGGDEIAAQKVAGRFVERSAVYSKDRIRENGHWKGPFDRVVEPRRDAARYGKPVVVLIGPKIVSSAESFLLMMRYGAKAKLFGQTTGGSSGRPMPHPLGNGVTVCLSSWEDQLPDGTLLQDHGVHPDITIDATLGDLMNSDPALKAALKSIEKL